MVLCHLASKKSVGSYFTANLYAVPTRWEYLPNLTIGGEWSVQHKDELNQMVLPIENATEASEDQTQECMAEGLEELEVLQRGGGGGAGAGAGSNLLVETLKGAVRAAEVVTVANLVQGTICTKLMLTTTGRAGQSDLQFQSTCLTCFALKLEWVTSSVIRVENSISSILGIDQVWTSSWPHLFDYSTHFIGIIGTMKIHLHFLPKGKFFSNLKTKTWSILTKMPSLVIIDLHIGVCWVCLQCHTSMRTNAGFRTMLLPATGSDQRAAAAAVLLLKVLIAAEIFQMVLPL
ncbi:hypothetical protein BJ742DRAFT_737353 [Cladochytrium replicatum]|nr:hypothetical protein BJ742DRAFT_737353 [Cladochytrium replicatum]